MRTGPVSSGEKLRGDLINAYKYLKDKCQDNCARLFSVAPRGENKEQWP